MTKQTKNHTQSYYLDSEAKKPHTCLTMADKKPLKITKIVIDRDLCIGAATCVTIAPGTFQMDAENKAILVNLEGNDAETILMAAESCPTKAIFLYDEDGNQVYPR